MVKQYKNQKGFTLIEVMVAIAIFAIVMATVVAAFQSQLTAHITQQQMADMQQNARGAMSIIKQDLRMAGWPPKGAAGAGITINASNSITLSMDIHDGIDNDSDTEVDEEDEKWTPNGSTAQANEVVTYAMVGNELQRNGSPLGLNVDAVDFVFLDQAGNVTVDPDEIFSAQITMVARAGGNVPVMSYKHTDTNSYFNQQGTQILAAQNDTFRRICLTSEVRCRNSGM